MPTPKKGARLGGSPAHQKMIVANLATSLFEHGRVTTTEAKARVLRPVAERLITKAKKGDLHNRRQVLSTIRDKGVVHTLFTEIAPHFAERPGGYTRITKIGPRKGDNAPMAVIELVTEEYSAAAKEAPAKKTAKKSSAKKTAAKKAAPAEEQATEVPAEEPAAEVSEEPTEEPAPEATEEPAAEAAPESAPEAEAAEAEAAEESADEEPADEEKKPTE